MSPQGGAHGKPSSKVEVQKRGSISAPHTLTTLQDACQCFQVLPQTQATTRISPQNSASRSEMLALGHFTHPPRTTDGVSLHWFGFAGSTAWALGAGSLLGEAGVREQGEPGRTEEHLQGACCGQGALDSSGTPGEAPRGISLKDWRQGRLTSGRGKPRGQQSVPAFPGCARGQGVNHPGRRC